MSSHKHTAVKTITYRLISWLSTTLIAWLIIGLPLASGTASVEEIASATLIFSIVDMIANTLIYYFYERACILIANWHKEKPKKLVPVCSRSTID
jgi:uncharacterized membrane protein